MGKRGPKASSAPLTPVETHRGHAPDMMGTRLRQTTATDWLLEELGGRRIQVEEFLEREHTHPELQFGRTSAPPLGAASAEPTFGFGSRPSREPPGPGSARPAPDLVPAARWSRQASSDPEVWEAGSDEFHHVFV